MRRTVAHARDEAAFRARQQINRALHGLEAEGVLEVYYFDEVGFSLRPVVPYAWQPTGAPRTVPTTSHRRLNVLGFLNKANRGYFHTTTQRVTTETVIEAFEAFATQSAPRALRLVVLDNASMHHSAEFRTKAQDWIARGVLLVYLPPYSPELNLIEILWQRIKYH